MSLRPQEFQAVPEETARIAQAAFPKGNLYMQYGYVVEAVGGGQAALIQKL